MSSISGITNIHIPAVSSKPPPAPLPAKPAADADGDNDGTTSALSKSDHSVDIKT